MKTEASAVRLDLSLPKARRLVAVVLSELPPVLLVLLGAKRFLAHLVRSDAALAQCVEDDPVWRIGPEGNTLWKITGTSW